MTSSEILQRLRGLLNEAGAGFWKDDELYDYIDSAQLEIIDICKSKQDFLQKTDKSYECVVLQPLIVLDTVTELRAGTQEYDLPGDFMFTYSMLLDVDQTFVQYKATLLGFDYFLSMEDNYFSRATSKNPRYYLRETKFGVKPLPSADGYYSHYYYKVPDPISAAVQPSLRTEAHNAIIWFAFSYALEQNNRLQESVSARQTAINSIKDL